MKIKKILGLSALFFAGALSLDAAAADFDPELIVRQYSSEATLHFVERCCDTGSLRCCARRARQETLVQRADMAVASVSSMRGHFADYFFYSAATGEKGLMTEFFAGLKRRLDTEAAFTVEHKYYLMTRIYKTFFLRIFLNSKILKRAFVRDLPHGNIVRGDSIFKGASELEILPAESLDRIASELNSYIVEPTSYSTVAWIAAATTIAIPFIWGAILGATGAA